MKTSELKKIVEDNGLKFEKLENTLFNRIITKDALCICSFHDNLHDIKVHNSCPKIIAQAILDYAYTPLEEREEEKKYRLKLPNGFESMLGEDYVCLTSDKVRERYVITAKETYHGFRNIFTQKEIDAMPFDTNFFIKEEV